MSEEHERASPDKQNIKDRSLDCGRIFTNGEDEQLSGCKVFCEWRALHYPRVLIELETHSIFSLAQVCWYEYARHTVGISSIYCYVTCATSWRMLPWGLCEQQPTMMQICSFEAPKKRGAAACQQSGSRQTSERCISCRDQD